MEVEEGPPVVKAARNARSYKLIKLRNGLSALLIHDPQVCNDDEEVEDQGGGEDMQVDSLDDTLQQSKFPSWNQQQLDQQQPSWPTFQYNCTGGDDFNSDRKPRLRFHPGTLIEDTNVQTSFPPMKLPTRLWMTAMSIVDDWCEQ